MRCQTLEFPIQNQAEQGGGFQCNRRLQVTNGSVVSLENVTAGSHAGGFTSLGQVEIAGNSTVNISSSHAESGDGGAFRTEKGLKGVHQLKTHHSECGCWKVRRRILCQRPGCDQQFPQ